MQKFVNVLLPLVALFALSSAIASFYERTEENAQLFENCVDIRQGLPCKGLKDGYYDICGGCTKGFYTQCKDEEIVKIKPCPVKTGENGEIIRLIFDSARIACVENSSSCIYA